MSIEVQQRSGRRLKALDAFRGLVVLLLVPDVAGGFSFYAMALQRPDDPWWAALARAFTHVDWVGAAVWDLVMPGFVFAAGAAMALSLEQRRERGDSSSLLLAHALVRAAMLIVLGQLLSIKPQSRLEEALPYLLLACALPWRRLLGSRVPPGTDLFLRAVGTLLCGAWLASHLDRLGNYDFNQILVQIGLASVPAFVLVGSDAMAPLRRAGYILSGWTLAFLAYPAPTPPRSGIEPVWFGHWDNGTNLAAAFDRWLLNLLPRAVEYTGNSHGYHTLTFVPLAALMLAGAAAARVTARRPADVAARRLAGAGGAAAALSVALALVVTPLVKSLWTASWTVFSASVCALVLAAMVRACTRWGGGACLSALGMLGGHALVLYVVSYADRWRIVALWDRFLGELLAATSWYPVLQSLLVLFSLWLLAALMERWRLRVRV